jgi:hypothetical protein
MRRDLSWYALGVVIAVLSIGLTSEKNLHASDNADQAAADPVGENEDSPNSELSADAPDPTKSPSEKQIEQWVLDLDSDRYIVRRTATEKLVLAGRPSIEPVAEMVQDASLEAITRGIHILQELAASSDFETETAAFAALESVAEKRATAAARRAAVALVGLSEYRRERSIRYLKDRGAEIGTSYVRDSEFTQRSLPSITFNENWTGEKADVRQLRWVVLADSSYIEPMFVVSKWLVVLNGKQFDNDWLEALTQINDVIGIRLVNSTIDNAGLDYLTKFEELRYFDMFYTKLDEGAYDSLKTICDHFTNVSPAFRMRMYGTELSNQRLASLGTVENSVAIDARRGGFLGISCQNDENGPCRISYIGEGSAAQVGGLRVEDIIEKYDGHVVQNFDTLMKRISDNAQGERVEIEITRLGKKEIKHVVLGRWEP